MALINAGLPVHVQCENVTAPGGGSDAESSDAPSDYHRRYRAAKQAKLADEELSDASNDDESVLSVATATTQIYPATVECFVLNWMRFVMLALSRSLRRSTWPSLRRGRSLTASSSRDRNDAIRTHGWVGRCVTVFRNK